MQLICLRGKKTIINPGQRPEYELIIGKVNFVQNYGILLGKW